MGRIAFAKLHMRSTGALMHAAREFSSFRYLHHHHHLHHQGAAAIALDRGRHGMKNDGVYPSLFNEY